MKQLGLPMQGSLTLLVVVLLQLLVLLSFNRQTRVAASLPSRVEALIMLESKL